MEKKEKEKKNESLICTCEANIILNKINYDSVII